MLINIRYSNIAAVMIYFGFASKNSKYLGKKIEIPYILPAEKK